MRVLHVIDACPPRIRELARPRPAQGFDDRVLACKLVCESIPHESRVCIIGTRQSAVRAQALGMDAPLRINPVLGSLCAAASGMSSLISAIRPDLVHWWGGQFSGGCFGRPGKAWRVEMLMGATPLGLPVWLSSGAAVVCGPEEEGTAKSGGLSLIRTESPVFATELERKETGKAIRLLLIGGDTDARLFRFFVGLIDVAGLPVQGIMPTEATQRARMRRSFRREWRTFGIDVSSSPRSDLLSQADIAIWMGGVRSAAIAIRSALASGIPVIAPPQTTRYFPESISQHCVGLNATPAELARKLIGLTTEPSLLREVGSAGKEALDPAEVNDHFARAVADAWSLQVGRDWLDPADVPHIVPRPVAEPAA
jgi:hypothetical protein